MDVASMRLRSSIPVLLSSATVTVLVDQATKAWAQAVLAQSPVRLNAFLDLRLTFNTGISFGLFQADTDFGRWLLIATTSAVVLVLAYWGLRTRRWMMSLALGAIAGGAVGNILDRIIRARVVDFVDVHVASFQWPVFNLADAAICTGVALLLLLSGRETPARGNTNPRRPEPQTTRGQSQP